MTGVITIKVTTDDPEHSYFVHFTRDGHDLVDICEYKPIYTPAMGRMHKRILEIVAAARTKVPETTSGEIQ